MTFIMLCQLVERATGISLERGGMSTTLERFVTGRMRKLGLARLEDYAALIGDPASAEQRLLISAITVPHTWFYRDAEQLQTIAGILPTAPPGPIAVWVAGCASGEEAYTLAMIGRRIGRELHVLATDVNEDALKAANRGVYSAPAIRDVPPNEMRWFSEQDGGYTIDPALRSNVRFVRHNLVDPPPQPPTARGGWDLIVCRNVLIYFSAASAARVLERFARALSDGGSLVVGGSEVVFDPPAGLKLVASGTRLVLRRMTALPAAPPVAFSGLARTTTDPLARRLATEPVMATMPRPSTATEPVMATMPRPSTATEPVMAAMPRPSTATEPVMAAMPRPSTATEPVMAAMPRPSTVTDPAIRIMSPATDPAISRDAPSGGRDEELIAALNRGHARFEAGDHSTAITMYAELARLYPSVAEVWLFLGIARYVRGEVPTAAHALRASLCLDPAMWPAGFYLARAYDRLGRHADAVQQYDLIAVDNLQPLVLQSSSAVINELRALRHDFRSAARRVAADRPSSRLFK
jgi:chemotaxis protein methyltransferase CheR